MGNRTRELSAYSLLSKATTLQAAQNSTPNMHFYLCGVHPVA
jgi:hypothetical protein